MAYLPKMGGFGSLLQTKNEIMKILKNEDYNKQPVPNMTLAKLKKRENKEYVLFFRCKKLGKEYKVGINSDLLVWAVEYHSAVPVSMPKQKFSDFKKAYKFFLNSCRQCLRENELVEFFG